MNRLKTFFIRAFFWTYERGSLPWDICCLVFLAIIFSTPKDFLLSYSRRPLSPEQIESMLKGFFLSLF